jgi:hypothetical protein
MLAFAYDHLSELRGRPDHPLSFMNGMGDLLAATFLLAGSPALVHFPAYDVPPAL